MGNKFSNIHTVFHLARKLGNEQPPPDIAICSQCDWSGDINDCKTDTEGDWESGYWDVHLCPNCADGGCVDDYAMTPQRQVEWEEWSKNNQ